jgi:hypothetical protein
VHRKKKVREFPVRSRDVTTKLSLGGNNDVITELFLPRGSLVSDIPSGDGKLVNLFYGVLSSKMDQAEIRLIRQIFIKGSVAEVFFPLLITLLASQQLIENLLDLQISEVLINIFHSSSGIPTIAEN